MKPCACAPITFLVGIISWSADSSHTKKNKGGKKTVCLKKTTHHVTLQFFSFALTWKLN